MKKVVVGIISKEINGVKKYLLISATKNFGEFTGFYYPIGGHIEKGEDEKTALIRETKEELNIIVNPTKQLTVTPGDVKDQITYWYLCDTNDEIDLTKIQKSEIADIRWFTKQEIIDEPKIWPATRKVFMEFI